MIGIMLYLSQMMLGKRYFVPYDTRILSTMCFRNRGNQ